MMPRISSATRISTSVKPPTRAAAGERGGRFSLRGASAGRRPAAVRGSACSWPYASAPSCRAAAGASALPGARCSGRLACRSPMPHVALAVQSSAFELPGMLERGAVEAGGLGDRVALGLGIARPYAHHDALHALERGIEVAGVVVPVAAGELELAGVAVARAAARGAG